MAKAKSSILNLAPYFWPEETGSAPYCTELTMLGAHRETDAIMAYVPTILTLFGAHTLTEAIKNGTSPKTRFSPPNTDQPAVSWAFAGSGF